MPSSIDKVQNHLRELQILADKLNYLDLLSDQGDFNIFDDDSISKPMPPDGLSASSLKWREFADSKDIFLEYCMETARKVCDNGYFQYADTLNKYVRQIGRICIPDTSYYGLWITSRKIDDINLLLRNMDRELDNMVEMIKLYPKYWTVES